MKLFSRLQLKTLSMFCLLSPISEDDDTDGTAKLSSME